MKELLLKCRLLCLTSNSNNEFTEENRKELLKQIEAELEKPDSIDDYYDIDQKCQFAESVNVDFEKAEWIFRLKPGFTAGPGIFAITRMPDYVDVTKEPSGFFIISKKKDDL